MTLKLDKTPQPLQPSFWIVVLSAGDRSILGSLNQPVVANVEFYQTRLVAYTRKEAIDGALKQLGAEAPKLYEHGNTIGGWSAVHVEGISATALEKMFKERGELERATQADAIKAEHNALLQEIISKKDVKLFHQALRDGRINVFERNYVHDQLTKDVDLELKDGSIISPMQL